ncbi:hypothetical protein JXO52_06165 [bacterium]|nr:hypothetical protein [bacterium]
MKKRGTFIGVLLSLQFALSLVAQQAAPDRSKAEEYISLAREQIRTNDYDSAIENGEKAIELVSDSSRYYFVLGNAYGLKAQLGGKLAAFSAARKCRAAWEKAIELDPDNIEARFSLFSFCLAAPGIVGGGKDKAEREAQEIFARDSTAGYMAWGQYYTHNDDLEKAEAAYRALLQLKPGSGYHRVNFGLMYQHFNRYDQAGEQFVRAADIDTNAVDAYYHLANNSLLAEQEYEQGLSWVGLFIAKLPAADSVNRAWGCYLKGKLLKKMDRKEEAAGSFQQALRLNPACEPAEKELKKLW